MKIDIPLMSGNRHRKAVHVIRNGIFPVWLQNLFSLSNVKRDKNSSDLNIRHARNESAEPQSVRLNQVSPDPDSPCTTRTVTQNSISFLWFSLFQLTKSITVFGIFFIHKCLLLKISVWVKKVKNILFLNPFKKYL